MKNFTLIFNDVTRDHFGKDVFLVPYYCGKLYDMDVNIVFPSNGQPSKYRGVNLIPIEVSKPIKSITDLRKEIICYLINKSRRINALMLFHLSINTLVLSLIYKLINPKGVLYIKVDGEVWLNKLKRKYDKPFTIKYPLFNNSFIITLIKIKRQFIRSLYRKMFNKANVISIETQHAYDVLKENCFLGLNLSTKIIYMMNGFDEEQWQSFSHSDKDLPDKENIFITVGKLGSDAKNTELILNSVENINLQTWKIILIGEISPSFQTIIAKFYDCHPDMKDKVIFTGPIFNKSELWSWYNRSKVFLFPSKYESFGIALLDAYRFKNYIVATDVGCAIDLIKNGYGEIISQNNLNELTTVMNTIIDDNSYLASKYKNAYFDLDVRYSTLVEELNLNSFYH